MRIALLTQYYKPEMGAPQNRLYEMITGLQKLGNEVIVVTGMPNYPTGKIFDSYKNHFSFSEEIDGVKSRRYWLYASNTRNKIPRILNMLSFSFTSLFSYHFLKRNKIDCLIVESPPLTLGITGYILSRLTGAKLVSNISDLWPLSARELGAISDGFLYRLLENIEKFIYRKSIFCMGQSSEIVEYIASHGANDTFLFRNGVDPFRFNADLNSHKSNNHFKIVYAGLLGFAQGIFDICQNIDFKSLGCEFHIYGAGGEQSSIQEYLKNHSDKGIYYHGKVSRDEIPEVLKSADASLVPLVKNIFGAVPSKIYESMAAGLPILFSGEGEGEKIIRDYDLGWCSKAKDFITMKSNILEMISNPNAVAIKRANCLECAKFKFNRPMQIAALNEYLQNKIKV